jgi:hypothetical protein
MNMTTRKAPLIALGSLAAIVAPLSAHAQDRIAVPLTDASRPVVLEINTFSTGINVSGTDGKEVVVTTRQVTPKDDDRDDGRRGPGAGPPGPRAPRAPRPGPFGGNADEDDAALTAGLHRVPNGSIGLTVTEENNVVTVKTDFARQPLALDISVPRNTSVHMKTVNGGDVTVTGVNGEHEISNTNGRVVANDIGGSLVASSTNGTLRASFTSVNPAKPMSFNTFNGNVDVTFPAKLDATLRVSSGNGDFYTDFDVKVQPQEPAVERGGQDGRYRVRLERETVATVGKGGPDIRFKTFNGNVMVRKR